MVKLALIQFAPFFLDEDKTIKKLEGFLGRSSKANLVVLPELANSGYNFADKKEAFQYSAEVTNSNYIDFIKSVAKKNKQYIVSGFNEREKNKIFNSSVLIGPEGLIGVYRKIHLFMKEKRFFSAGNLDLSVYDIGFARVGMLICYDWMFPEAWRTLALNGADLICHPSNLILPYCQKAVQVHCLVNRVYAVTCNRVGKEGKLHFTGKSIVADTKGELMLETNDSDEVVRHVTFDISAAQDKMITPFNHVFNDIRNHRYKIRH